MVLAFIYNALSAFSLSNVLQKTTRKLCGNRFRGFCKCTVSFNRADFSHIPLMQIHDYSIILFKIMIEFGLYAPATAISFTYGFLNSSVWTSERQCFLNQISFARNSNMPRSTLELNSFDATKSLNIFEIEFRILEAPQCFIGFYSHAQIPLCILYPTTSMINHLDTLLNTGTVSNQFCTPIDFIPIIV